MTWINKPNMVERLFSLKSEGYSESTIAQILSDEFGEEITKDAAGNFYRRNRNRQIQDEETINENDNLAKQLQKQQDRNRIERKTWRNLVRFENFLESYNEELLNVLKSNGLNINIVNHKSDDTMKKGIIHLTDLHINEIVNIPENKFDLEIASKRLEKLADSARTYLKANNVKDVLIACTGDFLIADRHLDQLLAMAPMRAQAVFVAVKLIEHFIIDLNQDFNITFAGVTGNESRIQKDMSYNVIATDNFDLTIYNMLRILFNNKITFIIDDPTEIVVELNNTKILLTHGYNIPRNNPDSKVNDLINKYNKRNVNLRLIIFGHYHSSFITDEYARGSSLVGPNTYAFYGLGLSGRASQNIHIISNDSVDTIKIDLQNCKNYTGYDISKEKKFFIYEPSTEMKVYKI